MTAIPRHRTAARARPSSARNLHKSFGGHVVLDGVNLSVAAGESLVIVGPSGTGKSVLLKHLIGLLRPDSGEVFVDGQNFWELDGVEPQRRCARSSAWPSRKAPSSTR